MLTADKIHSYDDYDWTNYGYSHYDDCAGDLDDEWLERYSHADEVWYIYGTGCYEGGGVAIVRFNGDKWDAVSLSHCSCYGPLDDGYCRKEHTLEEYDSLDDVLAAATDWPTLAWLGDKVKKGE